MQYDGCQETDCKMQMHRCMQHRMNDSHSVLWSRCCFLSKLGQIVHQNTNSSGSLEVSRSTTNTDEDPEKSEPQPMTLQKQMRQLRTTNKDFQKSGKLIKEGSEHKSAIQLLPSRSRGIFDKLWVVGKGNGMGEAKSSETSGSSQSPTSMIRGEVKISPSTTRDRRHSIS